MSRTEKQRDGVLIIERAREREREGEGGVHLIKPVQPTSALSRAY